MKTFILLNFLLLFLLSIPHPARHRDDDFGGLGSFELPGEEQVSSIILGSGSDSVNIFLIGGDPNKIQLQLGQLDDKGENEWTFEIITATGGLYNYIDDDGKLIAVGPHGFMVDISGSYAEYAEVSVNEAAWALGEYVVNGVNTIYDALEVEQDD